MTKTEDSPQIGLFAWVFAAIATAFALVPGLATIMTEMRAPPGRGALFGASAMALGAISLLLIYYIYYKRRQLTTIRVTRVVAWLAVGFLVAVIGHTLIDEHTVVRAVGWGEPGQEAELFFPLWTTGDLARLIEDASGRDAATRKFGPDDIAGWINEQPAWIMHLTIVVMWLTYVLTCLTVTVAFGVLAVAVSHGPRPDAGGGPEPDRSAPAPTE